MHIYASFPCSVTKPHPFFVSCFVEMQLILQILCQAGEVTVFLVRAFPNEVVLT